MTRNTTRRVEVATPIYDEDIKKRVLHIFNVMMSDNVKARIQMADGQYVRAAQNGWTGERAEMLRASGESIR